MGKLIQAVQMFKSGILNDGRAVPKTAITAIVDGTRKAMSDGFVPKVKIGMTHEQAEIKGTVVNIYEKNACVYGDIEIGEDVYLQLKSGEIPEDRSVEIAREFVLSTGETLAYALTGIVFGIDVPAAHQLASLFEEEKAVRAEYFERFSAPQAHAGEWEFGELLRSLAGFIEKLKDLPSEVTGKLCPGFGDMLANVESFAHGEWVSAQSYRRLSDEKAELEQRFEEFAREAFLEGMVNAKRLEPGRRETVSEYYDHVRERFGRDCAVRKVSALLSAPLSLHTKNEIPRGGAKTGSAIIDPTSH